PRLTTLVPVRSALPLALGLLLSQRPASRPVGDGAQEASTVSRLARVRAALEAGEGEEAFREAEGALAVEPQDLDLLDAAWRAAQALGRGDEALSYAAIAQDLAEEVPERKAFLEGVNRRVADLDPFKGKGDSLLREFGGTLMRLGESCAGRGLSANAVDL